MKKNFKKRNIWLYVMFFLQLIVSSCGDDVKNIDRQDNQNIPIISNSTNQTSMFLKEERVDLNKEEEISFLNVENLNTKFYEFLDRNPSLNVQFGVYHQGKNIVDESIFKYSVFGKDEKSTLLTKSNVNNSDNNSNIQLEFNYVNQWQQFISSISKHQDQFLITSGSYKIGDKVYETLKFRDVPPEVLIGFIFKFYLTSEEAQPDKLIPNYQASKLSYPLKLYLMLLDIKDYNQVLSKGFFSYRLDTLEKKTQVIVKLADKATEEVQGNINRLQDIVHGLNNKIARNTQAAKEHKSFDTIPIVPPAELVSLPPSLQSAVLPLSNHKNGSLSLSDSSTISDTWLKLGGSSWVKDAQEEMNAVLSSKINTYIQGLNQENTEGKVVFTSLSLFNTTIEVMKESGIPVNIEIEYKHPMDSEQLEPVFTADKFTLSIR